MMMTRWTLTWGALLALVSVVACTDDAPQKDQAAQHAKHDAAVSDDVDADDAGTRTPGDTPQAGRDAGKPDAPKTEKPDGGTPADKPAPKPEDKPEDKPGDAGTPPATMTGNALPRFFLPTTEPDNTVTPRVEVDANGGTHALYAAHAIGDAYYAYCPKDCTSADKFKVVRLKTDGTAHGTLRLTSKGQPRVLLSTLLNVYYAQCDNECTDESHWTISKIADINSDQDVTGNALALDPQDRPRFLMHTYLAYLGIGQKEPQTWFAQCDDGCNDASHWHMDMISDQIWYGSQLRYDSKGVAHVATGAVVSDMTKPTYKLGAYFECQSNCSTEDGWKGIGLAPMFEDDVSEVRPSIALALTKAGQPRVLALAKTDAGERRLLYFECDAECTGDHWQAANLSDLDKLGSGLDLVLDARDYPRFVFTLDNNIGLHYCDAAHCTADDAPWQLTKVELASDVPPDNIILWPNCTVDAWLLHDPTLALAPDGSVRVGYQATDISGGTRITDPSQPACVAGKDMVLSRMAALPSVSAK